MKEEFMKYKNSFYPLTLMLLLAGCNSHLNKVSIEPVIFNHPDEIIKSTDDTKGYFILADRRILAVMTFLNTVGYDEEIPGKKMHPLRVKIRTMVSDNLIQNPDKLNQWKRYYKNKSFGAWQYVNFALSMNADYPFRRVRPDDELSYKWMSRESNDLPEILNDFWTTAGLENIWANCKEDYINEIKRYDANKMAEQMDFLWEYLRMKRKDNYTIIHIPNPLYRHNTADAHRFENYFYSVDGPGSNNGGLNIHEYLHTIINQSVIENYSLQKEKLDEYFKSGKDASISASYQSPEAWTSECLVHALDSRIRANMSDDKKRIEAQVDSLTKKGYTLLKPFYDSLSNFEKSNLPFDQYLPIMLENLPVL